MTAASSACTMSSASSAAIPARAASRLAESRWPNSGTPESTRNALKPNTPARCSPASSPRLPGTAPPQKPTSTQPPRAVGRLRRSALAVVVGGRQLSGMSTSVVTPPSAEARVALAKPSHSVRPGSLTWTWVSTTPGSSTSWLGSSSTRTASGASPWAARAAIRPSRTATVAGRMPSGVTTRRARITSSYSAMHQSLGPGGVPPGRLWPRRGCHCEQPIRCLNKPSTWRYGGGMAESRPSSGGDAATPGLARLNALPDGEAVGVLLGCCSAPGWARRVVGARPFGSVDALLAAADAAWAAREPGELEAAMAGHPRIGERRLSAQSRQEQSGVGSDPGTIQALQEANAAYEDRFGHVFLICASGRGPDEILAELRRRMAHDPATELEVAAAEIGKINALRLRKLVTA